MCADPSRAGACAALTRRRRTAPPFAFEWTSNARAPGIACAVPQVLRIVRPRVGRAERGPASRQGSAPRGARRGRPSPALLLPRPPGGTTEARGDRAEARGRRPPDARRVLSRRLDGPHGAERDNQRAAERAARGGCAANGGEGSISRSGRHARPAPARAPAIAFRRLRRRDDRGGGDRPPRGPRRRSLGGRMGRLHDGLRRLDGGSHRSGGRPIHESRSEPAYVWLVRLALHLPLPRAGANGRGWERRWGSGPAARADRLGEGTTPTPAAGG